MLFVLFLIAVFFVVFLLFLSAQLLGESLLLELFDFFLLLVVERQEFLVSGFGLSG